MEISLNKEEIKNAKKEEKKDKNKEYRRDFKKDNDNNEEINKEENQEDKKEPKNNRFARALLKFKKDKEKKKEEEEDSGKKSNNLDVRKSSKVSNIAKDLENTLNKKISRNMEQEETPIEKFVVNLEKDDNEENKIKYRRNKRKKSFKKFVDN